MASKDQRCTESGMPDPRTLGQRITHERNTHGWSQGELARRTRIRPERLSRLERGLVEISVGELVRLGQTFGAGLDELVFGRLEGPAQRWAELKGLTSKQEAAVLGRLLKALLLGLPLLPEAEREERCG
jgi:transcriptional regulator with XRE-family HTH domain